MFETFMVTFREGIEAFLIIAISLAYLKNTGRGYLVPAIHWGIGAALVVSLMLGVVLTDLAENPLFEGILAWVAAALVFSLTLHMIKAGRHMKKMITDRLESSASKQGFAAFAGIFLFTVLMISREGMETVLLLTSISGTAQAGQMVIGGILGLGVAAGMGYLWAKKSHLINLPLFLRVTAVFLLVFCAQLVMYGFHELTEVAALPIDNDYWHVVTEEFAHDGIYAQIMSYSIVVVPVVWLLGAMLRQKLVPAKA